jgi:hypothetical protein
MSIEALETVVDSLNLQAEAGVLSHIPQARYLPIGIFSRHIAPRYHRQPIAVDASGERLKIVRDTAIKIGHTERWRAEWRNPLIFFKGEKTDGRSVRSSKQKP